jgi:hypothetical protein
MTLGTLSKCLAQSKDGLGECMFLDEGVGPYAFKQRVLRDHVAAVLQQYLEQVECLGGQEYALAVQQETFPRRETEWPELID